MTTTLNPAVSVACEEDTLMALNDLAKKRKVSISTLAMI